MEMSKVMDPHSPFFCEKFPAASPTNTAARDTSLNLGNMDNSAVALCVREMCFGVRSHNSARVVH
jgi:hypothetical protein